MKFSLIHLPFYFGLFIALLGMLFKIQHWPGGYNLLYLGLLLQAIFIILILTEIFTSKKADSRTKLIWGLPNLVIPIISVCFMPMLVLPVIIFASGIRYLSRGRKHFIVTKRDLQQSDFDSI